METVLPGFILVFVILFAALTLSGAAIQMQDTLGTSWQAMQDRLNAQASTQLSVVGTEITDGGNAVNFAVRNSGTVKLMDFSRWDVFVEYFDEADPVSYHILRLDYAVESPASNQWAVAGIYQDAANDAPEVFEPHVFNPGETVVLTLQLAPQIGHGTAYQVSLTTGSGFTASSTYTRNALPELAVNAGLSMTVGDTQTIGNTLLEASDEDNEPAELTYSVTVTPTQGTLNLGDSFTQEDIDNGLLTYTHSGAGDDSFQFMISDGEDEIGPFEFDITVSAE